MKTYNKPEIEIIKFDTADIICTSTLIDGEVGDFGDGTIVIPQPNINSDPAASVFE